VPMKISGIICLLGQDWWVLKCTTGFTGTSLTRRSKDWLPPPGRQALPEAEEPIQHPEAGRLVKGAAVRGYVVVFEGDNESGYSAYSPDLPGVVAAGATHDETQRLMLEAMAEHLALLRQAGEPVPQPAEAESVMLLDPAAA
jgi:predicted RNase H-like HicB family nuclease